MASRRILILGTGPAGLSAALWLKNLGREPLLLDTAAAPGGLQNLNFLPNDWVLGQPGLTGPVLAARLVEHVLAAGVTLRTGVVPRRLAGSAGAFRLDLADGTALDAAAVLIATGTRYRGAEALAEVAGLTALGPEHIAFGPHAFADLAAQAGRRLLIVGGGDNAYENARLLAPRAAQIDLLVRGRPRAQPGLAAAVAAEVAAGRCRLWQPAALVRVEAEAAGIAATVALPAGDERLSVDRIHVLVGYEPNTAAVAALLPPDTAAALACDDQGYLRTDASGRTGVPGLYAAGDVCNPEFPSVVSAIAQGACAAKAIDADLRDA